jgi:hypothetical protein
MQKIKPGVMVPSRDVMKSTSEEECAATAPSSRDKERKVLKQ